MPTSPLLGGGNVDGGGAAARRDAQAPTVAGLRPGSPSNIAAITQAAGSQSAIAESRIGTRLRGSEGLSEPGSEAPKLRLVAGGVVPGTRYRILRWLGEGGMGVVYEAEHMDIERKVALKILRFDLSRQPHMVQVFRDEARAASRLGSAHIVEIYDFGELSDGRLFFAMELLAGRNLVPAPGDPPMDEARLIAIVRQVCKGLHVAHRAGVVHRDIKPENLVATFREGRADAIKIVDFGISAMLAAGNSAAAGVAGTPHYMPPEQIGAKPFDGRLDIYALGCTAYELLTGRPPFEGQTVQELLCQQLEATPKAPSAARPDLAIAPALDRVILRCLAKDPEARYADMADLEAALCEAQIEAGITTAWDDLPLPDLPDLQRRERLLREMPSPLGLATPPVRPWVWPLVAALSVVLIAAVAWLAVTGIPRNPAADPSQLELLARSARDAAAKAHWVVPPARKPDTETAFSQVVALEALDDESAELARKRAAELRSEFADTLTRQADLLADQGASLAASTHYLWALVFDPSNRHAFAEAKVDTSLLAAFIERAKHGEFSQAELAGAMASLAQAEPDPAAREQKLADYRAMVEEADISPAVAILLADEMRVPAHRSSRREAKPEPPTPAPPAPEPESEPIVAAEEVAAAQPTAEVPAVARRKPKRLAAPSTVAGKEPARDPARSGGLASQGLDALRAGRRRDATALFNQALAADNTNSTALMGLADIYFDTGADQKAVVFAEKAVAAAPTNHAYRIKLGDAYFKVLRYSDALTQYEVGKKLGSSRAAERMARVHSKLGG